MVKKRTKFGSDEQTDEGEVIKKKESFYKRNKKAIKRAAIATGTVAAVVSTHYIAKRFSPAYAEKVKNVRLPKIELPSFLRRKKEGGDKPTDPTVSSTIPINEVHELHKEEDTTYNERKQALLERQKSNDPQEQRDARVEFDQLQRDRQETIKQREQSKREDAIRIKQELDEKRQLAEQEKKERKNPLEWALDTSQKINTLRNDPLLGPVLDQLFKEIPKLMESFEEKDKQDTDHALEEVEKAGLELNDTDDDSHNQEVAKKKLKDAEDKLNIVNARKERYNEITIDIKYQKDLLSKETNKTKKEEILKNLGELQQQLKDLIENKNLHNESQESQESQETKKSKKIKFGKRRKSDKKGKNDKRKLKKLKKLKRDLLVLRNF